MDNLGRQCDGTLWLYYIPITSGMPSGGRMGQKQKMAKYTQPANACTDNPL